MFKKLSSESRGEETKIILITYEPQLLFPSFPRRRESSDYASKRLPADPRLRGDDDRVIYYFRTCIM